MQDATNHLDFVFKLSKPYWNHIIFTKPKIIIRKINY